MKKSGAPSPGEFPEAFAWFCLVSLFEESVRKSWGAPSAAGKPQAEGGKQKKEKKEAAGGGGKNAK